MAELLVEYADTGVDLHRVQRMLLVHDLVEIDAGDTFCYDSQGNRDKVERETAAADRIFAMLPEGQARELRELWEEFEAGKTPEARFANALDRLMPLLHNYHTQGRSWRKHGVRKAQVLERNRSIEDGSRKLWNLALGIIEDSVRRGYLEE